MEKLSQLALRSGSGLLSQPSTRRLPDAQVGELAVLLKQTAARYPHQDLSGAMEGYLHDFEMLALRYGTGRVVWALRELRIRPGVRFFPQPSEVAEVIEELMAKEERVPIMDCKICANFRHVSVRNEQGRQVAVKECQCLLDWRQAKKMRELSQGSDRKMEAAGA